MLLVLTYMFYLLCFFHLGSDVNSMDSVDSGCALGNSEQFQNMKQKSDAKKADVVIWEFEVPKVVCVTFLWLSVLSSLVEYQLGYSKIFHSTKCMYSVCLVFFFFPVKGFTLTE